mmetsp:Transcript_17709/g.23336  ORF Transcript_17709/g.23336 Transcript_17709/m.23336 type:complete len:795 (-) Transcript_17709:268-2652(-)|eukprot:CAMPEP_0117747318 /NCGR_PEP_ID=MMETSP0947-20121206/8436_1 /TAXON_ID=44440 /ORGANISM="Chattonella subsalsa, Strain CCMP2191" /LENGTH=794 /DNA_ID=CAMNT_0005564741 /DNA_START=472 /DNA_END=2856 /DNA_ORIENTATION=+
MSANRKLQTEIDRCLKKVEEGVELFDETWEKVYSATQQNQKEKYEVDLKKEIKKLQRLRDQIKTWIASNDIKDKSQLIDARKLIETKMEQFKVCEKETKTKTYSKEGLMREAKMDPREKEKNGCRNWIQDTIEKLNQQLELMDADLEQLMSGKGKRTNRDKIEELDTHTNHHKTHINKLEAVQRLLDNDVLTPAQIDEIKDEVEYYVDENQEPGFMEMYDESQYPYEVLNLDDSQLTPANLIAQKEKTTLKEEEETETTKSDRRTRKEKKKAAAASASAILPNIGRPQVKTPSKKNKAENPLSVIQNIGKARVNPEPAPSVVSEKAPAQAPSPSVAAPATQPALHQNLSVPAASQGAPPGGFSQQAPSASQFLQQTLPPAAQRTQSAPGPNTQVQSGRALEPGQAQSTPPPGVAPPQAVTRSQSGGSLLGTPITEAGRGGSGSAPTGGAGSSGPPSSQSSPSFSNLQPPGQAAPGQQSVPASQPNVQQHTQMTQSQSQLLSGPPPQQSSQQHQPPQPGQLGVPPMGTPQQHGPSGLGLGGLDSLSAGPGLPSAPHPQQQHSQSLQQQQGSDQLSGPPGSAGPSVSLGSASVVPGAAGLGGVPSRGDPAAPGQGPASGLGPGASKVGGLGGPPQQVSATTASQPQTHQHHQHQMTLNLLQMSMSHCPTQNDSERPKHYVPRNPYPTLPSFPSAPSPAFENPAMFEKFSTDTLFFIFYYQQGTYQQYLAARELKKQSWRYHKKYMTWFQRHEEPKVTNDEYEQGTYVYFDYETGWCKRIKTGFTFEYNYLEDELIV